MLVCSYIERKNILCNILYKEKCVSMNNLCLVFVKIRNAISPNDPIIFNVGQLFEIS